MPKFISMVGSLELDYTVGNVCVLVMWVEYKVVHVCFLGISISDTILDIASKIAKGCF